MKKGTDKAKDSSNVADKHLKEGNTMFSKFQTQLQQVLSGGGEEESKDDAMGEQRDNLKRSHSFDSQDMLDNV